MTTQPSISETPEFDYTHFWVRLSTYVIDILILGIILSIIRGLLSYTFSLDLSLEKFLSDDQELIITPFFSVSALILGGGQLFAFWLYYALSESRLGASPGKLLFKLRVTGLDGRRIDFKRATAHTFARILSFLPFLTGYLMAAFTDKTQTLHDILSGCIVIPVKQVITTPVVSEIENKEEVEIL